MLGDRTFPMRTAGSGSMMNAILLDGMEICGCAVRDGVNSSRLDEGDTESRVLIRGVNRFIRSQ